MYQRILVPIDGSPTSQRGLDQAIGIARLGGGSIRLLHVLDDLRDVSGFETPATYLGTVLPLLHRRSERILADGRSQAEAAAVPVETVVVECLSRRASDVIVEQARAWPADLIVLGTHGRRGIDRVLLGSDAEQVLRRATVPVLLVRGTGESGTPAADLGAMAAQAPDHDAQAG